MSGGIFACQLSLGGLAQTMDGLLAAIAAGQAGQPEARSHGGSLDHMRAMSSAAAKEGTGGQIQDLCKFQILIISASVYSV